MTARSLLLLGLLCSSCIMPVKDKEPAPPPEPVEEFRTLLFERYVERYDATGPQESWVYGADGLLKEHSHYRYDIDTFLVGVDTYPSDTVTTPESQISRLDYTYDALGNTVGGESYHRIGDALVLIAAFTAQYNDQGAYTDYLETDGQGTVTEHRTCTYDVSGLNYLVETYYSDAGTTNKVEEYHCTYDSSDTTKWTSESHYQKITGLDPDSVYERTLTHRFSWNGESMYQQTDFDEAGTMMGAILYTFDGTEKRSRSQINQEGKLIRYRTYQSDASGTWTDVRNFNCSLDPSGVLEHRESTRLWGDEETGYFYEKAVYTRQPVTRSLVVPVLEPSLAPLLALPLSVHHRE